MKKGEIYYVENNYTQVGSEQQAGRPAVIVSNDKNNEHSTTVEVVYLTTQPKTDLPTHVTVHGTGRQSTAICEQISTVSKDRLSKHAGTLNANELQAIDIAMAISLRINIPSTPQAKEHDTEKLKKPSAEQNSAAVERDIYKMMYEQLLEKVMVNTNVR